MLGLVSVAIEMVTMESSVDSNFYIIYATCIYHKRHMTVCKNQPCMHKNLKSMLLVQHIPYTQEVPIHLVSCDQIQVICFSGG